MPISSSISRRFALKAGLLTAAASIVPAQGAEMTGSQTKGASSTESRRVSSGPEAIAVTASGKVQGFIANGVYTFKGIPYGAPTDGARRFMAPAKPEPWTGVRSCLSYGHACSPLLTIPPVSDNKPAGDEDAFLLYRMGTPQGSGEDCLRLNVWTPELGRGKRPVLVYAHGGGYVGGSSNDLLSYDGENLAKRHDAVVVTHNHRLHVLGFLNLHEISSKYADSANVSMLDQIAVLEWVRNNIESFGGDPSNVTIFGQSGGGGKVSTLMAMPGAKGLFHRAIIQSGDIGPVGIRPASGELATSLLAELGINRNNVGELQKIPVDRLTAATVAAVLKAAAGKSMVMAIVGGFGPSADGKNIPENSWVDIAPSVSADVPLIIGSNLNEFVNGVDNPNTDLSELELMKRLQTRYGAKAEAIAATYRHQHPRERPFGIWAAINTSGVRRATAELAAKKAALHAAPVYQYVYAWRTPALNDRPGTFHSAEISMVFDNADKCANYSCGSTDGLALSSNMSRAWTSFARSGNPNHPGLPSWPAFDKDKQSTMIFNTTSASQADFEGAGLRLLAEFPDPGIEL